MIAAILLASAGCGVDTNAPDCASAQEVSGFTLYVNENPGLEDGVYTWTVTSDGVRRTRTVTVQNGHGICDCSDRSNPPAGTTAEDSPAELTIRMEQNGAQMSLTDDPALGGMTLPSHIEVDLARGGVQIATFTFDPTYHQLDGGCPGTVRSTFFVNVVGP